MTTVVAIDTETYLIGAGDIAPKLVCCSMASHDAEPILLGNTPDELAQIHDLLVSFLQDDEVRLVFHNAAFDLTVLVRQFPDLMPLIFEKLARGGVTDTKLREKLLNLSTTGKLDMLEAPDGSKTPIRYSLATLVLDYMGIDRAAEKDGDDIWRLNFNMLDGKPAADYPRDASDYAKQDAVDTLQVYDIQEARTEGQMTTQEFHTAADFALRLQTCWGIAIDPVAVAEITAEVEEALRPEKLQLLIESKILTPAKPAQPYKNGAIDKETGEVKMRAPTKDKISKKLLQAHIVTVCEANGLDVRLTPPSKTYPDGSVATSVEVIDKLAPLDDLLAEYQHRQKLQKLVTTYLPQLQDTATIHPDYDVLKETGRTSSYAGKLYPSCNIQQIDPRVRRCYVPRPGHVFCAVDYSTIELASFAQVCYDLFGYSTHRDKINEGVDLHAYLGAQLAVELGGMEAPMGRPAYEFFQASDPDFYDKWRGMAKPTGLGLPGGMGVATFCEMALKTYKLKIPLEMGERMKEIWFDTYPEVEVYFEWIKQHARDWKNKTIDEWGQPAQLYAYTSPLGMYRAGATYCAAANGKGLQTPTSEGAKMAVFQVARACYDWTRESPLFHSRPVMFIHDELIVEIPRDDLMHERAMAISRGMVESMQHLMPDVKIKAKPCLMNYWDKKAKPVYEGDRLQIWTPTTSE